MTYSGIEDPVLAALAEQQCKSAHRIFHDRVQSGQLMCSIYDVFDEPGSPNHNCLGCNFDEITDQISKFLSLCAANPRRPLKNPLVGVVCTLKTEPYPFRQPLNGMKRAIWGNTGIFFVHLLTRSCP